MDINAIVTDLMPFMVKGGEKIASRLGKDLWDSIWKSFDDDDSKELLADFQNDPTNPDHIGAVKHKLKRFVKSNPEVASKLEKKLPQININSQVNTNGDHNTIFSGIYGSTINYKS